MRPNAARSVRVLSSVLLVALAIGGCVFVDPGRSGSPPPPPRPAGGGPSGGATSSSADPTQGQFINTTPWALSVWIDGDPVNTAGAAPVVIQPGATTSWTLSRGQHRIVAHARDPAASGERVIGRYDRTIELDPQRAGGWFLRFRETDFR
jgi:hypothetical protein